MSRRSRLQYSHGHGRISGVALPGTLTQVREACVEVHLRSVLRFASSFHPTRPHGKDHRRTFVRRLPRAVAFNSRLPPTDPAKDFHLQSLNHAQRTQSGYALLPFRPPPPVPLPTSLLFPSFYLLALYCNNQGGGCLTHYWHGGFSPDGKRIASGSSDKTVKVWDATTGRELFTLPGHSPTLSGVAFSPDGKRIASASRYGTVKLWDATAGQELFTLRGHSGSVTAVAFSPDGRRIVSASRDRTVKLWDATTGQEAFTLYGNADAVTDVAISPNGRQVVSGNYDGTVKTWTALDWVELINEPVDSR